MGQKGLMSLSGCDYCISTGWCFHLLFVPTRCEKDHFPVLQLTKAFGKTSSHQYDVVFGDLPQPFIVGLFKDGYKVSTILLGKFVKYVAVVFESTP